MKNDNLNTAFIEKCRNVDFSSESANKEKNLEILKSKLKNIENERDSAMNKKFKMPVALIAAAVTLICLSAAVYGQDLVRIIKTVVLGSYAEYYVIEDNRDSIPIPEELKGLVFDKDGNALVIVPDNGVFYNDKGEEVRPIFDDGKARLMTIEEFNATQNTKWSTYYDLEEGKSYFICDTLSPGYLPDGYKFDRVEFYVSPENQDSMEQGTEKYMSIYYSNGKYEMYSQVRYMDEETAFGSSATEGIQKIKINGYDAVLDKNTLDIQIDDVMYMFFTTEDSTTDDLVKMAESLEYTH